MFKPETLTWLDCTLRDGGYHNGWNFKPERVRAYLDARTDDLRCPPPAAAVYASRA